VILLINKIDLIQKDRILPLIETYKKIYPFKEIIPVSALGKDGLDQTVQEAVKLLPQNPPYYPSDYVTDQHERFFVAERSVRGEKTISGQRSMWRRTRRRGSSSAGKGEP
jgi:GTP-binding protein Era